MDFFPYVDDFVARKGEEAVDRAALLDVLTDFLEANNLKVDWEGIESAPNEALVNALAMMSPYGPAEKQAMLEAPDLKTRAEILIAVTEMDLAKKRTSGDAAAVGNARLIQSPRRRGRALSVAPSAFAVFKLITSSNLVGCSTGRSAGFAPLKILSTKAADRRCKSRKLTP